MAVQLNAFHQAQYTHMSSTSNNYNSNNHRHVRNLPNSLSSTRAESEDTFAFAH